MKNNFQEKVSFIWSVADLLRGDYRPNEYQNVILPLTVLRRLDAVLEPTKDKVLKRYLEVKKKLDKYDSLLKSVSGYPFYNTSKFTFKTLMQDPDNIAINLKNYINGFSQEMYDIIENFEFDKEIDKLNKADLLYLLIEKFNSIDLHPDSVANHEMGTIFEELIRKFSEQSNETAGEHFTPREVIRLMVKLIVAGNGGLKTPNIIKAVYDPACGTGGMLTIAKNEIVQNINSLAKVFLYGQELNAKTYAIAKSDTLIKGENANNIKKGNSFSEDQLEDEKFDFMLSNPPYGVDWKKVAKQIRAEHENLGFDGRFGAGLPRVSDGSLLFLQHMISKMKPVSDGGSRIAIIFNGSPLFTGDAGSGESEIRKWIIENDWLELIVGLPDQLFYNTGIHTYIWIVTNNKPKEKQGKIQLVDSRKMFEPMRKSLGNKRHYLSDEQINEIVKIYKGFENKGKSKIFNNTEFGYRKITIDRPSRLSLTITSDIAGVAKPHEGLSIASAVSNASVFDFIGDLKPERSHFIFQKMLGKTYISKTSFIKNFKQIANQLGFVAKNEHMATQKIESIADIFFKNFGKSNEKAVIYKNSKGDVSADSNLRDTENVSLSEDIHEYFEKEVKPYVPDAWIDESKTKIGYEINFTRYFYKYKPLRPLDEIEKDIKKLEGEISELTKSFKL